MGVSQKIALVFVMAILTNLLAQISFYLPFSPVLATGQVLGVLRAELFVEVF